MIDAYCDTCFTPCTQADAHDGKPCRKCGNLYFFIIDREHPMPSGNLAYHSERERNLNAFLDASMVMSEIRVTNMTMEDFERFVSAGETCLAVYDKAQDEEKELEKRAGLKFELPPVVEFPIRLPDMYMRYGRWDDARRVYGECRKSRYLREYDFDFDRLTREAEQNEYCVSAIIEIIENGEHSQKSIKKQLTAFAPRAINWVLRYYKGLSREKRGSDYSVELAEFIV